jgi:hypothetical protein
VWRRDRGTDRFKKEWIRFQLLSRYNMDAGLGKATEAELQQYQSQQGQQKQILDDISGRESTHQENDAITVAVDVGNAGVGNDAVGAGAAADADVDVDAESALRMLEEMNWNDLTSNNGIGYNSNASSSDNNRKVFSFADDVDDDEGIDGDSNGSMNHVVESVFRNYVAAATSSSSASNDNRLYEENESAIASGKDDAASRRNETEVIDPEEQEDSMEYYEQNNSSSGDANNASLQMSVDMLSRWNEEMQKAFEEEEAAAAAEANEIDDKSDPAGSS